MGYKNHVEKSFTGSLGGGGVVYDFECMEPLGACLKLDRGVRFRV